MAFKGDANVAMWVLPLHFEILRCPASVFRGGGRRRIVKQGTLTLTQNPNLALALNPNPNPKPNPNPNPKPSP